MRKFLRLVKGTLCFVVALVILCFFVLCAWAATGPRDLTKYADFVEISVNGAVKNNHIKIGKTYIEWTNIEDLLSIKANDVEIYDNATNQKIATFPKVTLKYGILSLMGGNVIPSELKLVSPEIDLTNLVHKGQGSGISLEDLNLSRLDHVSVYNGVLIAPDKSRWNIASASLWYNSGDIRVNAEVSRGEDEAIEAAFRTNADMTESYLKASFNNFHTENLAYYVPEIVPAKFIVSGRASYSANKSGKKATFSVDKFNGEFDDGKIFKYKLEVKDGAISGSYDLSQKILNVDHIHSYFEDDLEIDGKGSVTNFEAVDGEATIANLKTSNIKKYWPSQFGQNALSWVSEHVSGGVITQGTAKLKINPGDTAGGSIPKNDLALKFNFENVGTTYIDKLTPVTNASGSGFMDGDSLKVNVGVATLGNSQVTNAEAMISNIDKPGESLKVSGHIEGPVDDLADFYIQLNQKQKLFKDKKDITGKAVSDVVVRLPLLAKLRTEDVQYDVKAQISDAAVKNFFGKLNVDHLQMTLAGNNKDYTVKGQTLASFGEPGDVLVLKDAPVGFSVASKNGQLGVAFESNITNTPLEFAPLEIKKAVGEPGRIMAEVVDSGGANPVVNKLIIESKPLRVAANGTLTKDYGGFAGLNISTLEFGKSSLQARILSSPILTAELKGKYFDAAPIIRYMKKDRKEDNSQYKILLKADEVGLLNNRSLKNAAIMIVCGASCDTINIDSKEIMFNQANGLLKIKTENAGNILDAFDIYSNMVGGKLDVVAKANGSIYDGKLAITDFSIVKAKVLARMLTLGSLTGIADILSGNGITFKKLSTEFHMDKHAITVNEYRMVGPAIGITAKGTIDRDKNVADISGNIIPAYTANTLLGSIPLIGPVVIGDEGVFALAYKLTGNVDDPSISVNPLSVLAPGFLKNLFQ